MKRYLLITGVFPSEGFIAVSVKVGPFHTVLDFLKEEVRCPADIVNGCLKWAVERVRRSEKQMMRSDHELVFYIKKQRLTDALGSHEFDLPLGGAKT